MALESFEWIHLPFLFFAVLLGESFGAVIGGGSIIVQPALLLTGLPLNSVVAMDNSMALGTEVGILSEAKAKVLKHWRLAAFMFVPTMIGGVLGTWFLLNISVQIIKILMIVTVSCLLLYSFFAAPRMQKSGVGKWQYTLLAIVVFLLGVYNNFVGVGEGTFAKLALMLLLGLSFTQSHGIKTAVTFPIRLYSLIVTASVGLIVWPYLLIMWVGAFIAGKYATKYVTKVPTIYMKPVMTIISLGFVTYLLISL